METHLHMTVQMLLRDSLQQVSFLGPGSAAYEALVGHIEDLAVCIEELEAKQEEETTYQH